MRAERRTDPTLRVTILRVREGAGGGYWVTECRVCGSFWQVPYFAEENVG